jgi:hypothetical protein
MTAGVGEDARRCAFCFDFFQPVTNRGRFCSDICREEYLAGTRRAAAFDPSQAVRKCKFCDQAFIPCDTRELFCSRSCSNTHFNDVRQRTGKGAEYRKRWSERHPEKALASAKRNNAKRYWRLKSDPENYQTWRESLDAYQTPEKKRAAARKKNAQRALSLLLLPTHNPPEVNDGL